MLTLSIFCSPFLRQMLCERHDLTFGPGSEMWIHLTMQFKEIHILKKRKKKRGATTSTWDVLVILPCQKCHWRLRLNVIYFNQSFIFIIYLLYLFTYLPFEFIFLLKRKKKLSRTFFTSWQILTNVLKNSFYFLIALVFFKWIIYKAYNSFVMLRCFKPAVSLLRHWCRKHACSAKSFCISCFVSGRLICFSLFPWDFS